MGGGDEPADEPLERNGAEDARLGRCRTVLDAERSLAHLCGGLPADDRVEPPPVRPVPVIEFLQPADVTVDLVRVYYSLVQKRRARPASDEPIDDVACALMSRGTRIF